MATIRARRDRDAGYAYFTSGDSFAPPGDVRDLIKSAFGQFSDATKSWRVPLDRSGDLLIAIRAEGHTVVVNEGERAAPHRPLWCESCHVAVRCSDSTAQQCPRCSGPLVCDGACAADGKACVYAESGVSA